MSFEQLIVLALLILLPLLESVLRKRRNRTRSQHGEPGEHVAQVRRTRQSAPSPDWQGDEGLVQMEHPEIIPPLPSVRPPLPPAHRVLERPVPRAPLRVSERRADVPSLRQALRRTNERADRDGTPRWISSARDLRSAIVLTTILSPCRALEPSVMPHGSLGTPRMADPG
jgi:hypothetical protein